MAKSYKALEQDIKNDKYGYVQLVQMMDQLQLNVDKNLILAEDKPETLAKISLISSALKAWHLKDPKLQVKEGNILAVDSQEIVLDVQEPLITRDAGIDDEDVARKFLQLKDSARKRNIEFNLNLTTVRNLLKAKRCAYSGLPFDYTDPKKSPTVDRKDHRKGYVKGNVVSCRQEINELKNVLIEHPLSIFKDDIKLLIKTVCSWEKGLED